jgi:hypothetical protein
MKKLSFSLKRKTKPPWAAPTLGEQFRRVLKGKTAHPNDERNGIKPFLKSFLPKKRE